MGTRQQRRPAIRAGTDCHKIHDLCTAHFVRAKSNVVLLGPLGVGKSSLALALAMAACEAGFSICFTVFDELVHRLRSTEAGGRYDQQLQAYLRPAVLVVDDFGSQAIDQAAAFMVLQVLSGRHDRGSTIVTSSRSFTDWRHILGDAVLATAILDRLLHHCDVINLSAHGPSAASADVTSEATSWNFGGLSS